MSNPTGAAQSVSDVAWVFEDLGWRVEGNPPNCPDPLVIEAPVDVRLASGVLYPGQHRGGDYKTHGGFRFDNRATNDVTVTAIMDGHLWRAAHYLEGGEVQYFALFINDCGIMYRYDHLLTLSPKLSAVFEDFPPPVGGDSRTVEVRPRVYVEEGEVLATEIGLRDFEGDRNIFMDFGLYDLRKTNEASKDPEWAAEHPNEREFGVHALCWLDNLNEPEKGIVKGLPGSGVEGKTSDYCD
jgi:hypothetical protein